MGNPRGSIKQRLAVALTSALVVFPVIFAPIARADDETCDSLKGCVCWVGALGAEALAENALKAKKLAKEVIPKFLEHVTNKICHQTYNDVAQGLSGFVGLLTRTGHKVVEAFNLFQLSDVFSQQSVTIPLCLPNVPCTPPPNCSGYWAFPDFQGLCENGEIAPTNA